MILLKLVPATPEQQDAATLELQAASLALADRATQSLTDRAELASRWIGVAA